MDALKDSYTCYIPYICGGLLGVGVTVYILKRKKEREVKRLAMFCD